MRSPQIVYHTRFHVTGIPEREEIEKGAEEIFDEVVAEEFVELIKDIMLQI